MADDLNNANEQQEDTSTDEKEYFVNEYPRYPEGLKIYPESYTIYVEKDKLHPVSESLSEGE